MANIHHFNDSQNPSSGGRWTDDYDRKICTWTYDDPRSLLEVSIGIGPVHCLQVPVDGRTRSASDLGTALARLALHEASLVLRENYEP